MHYSTVHFKWNRMEWDDVGVGVERRARFEESTRTDRSEANAPPGETSATLRSSVPRGPIDDEHM